jgi:hypothetical protein
MSVLVDTEDLQIDYKMTHKQTCTLRDSIPLNGGIWSISDEFISAVQGEMRSRFNFTRSTDDARDRLEQGQALAIERLATRLEKLLTFNPKEWVI